MDFLTTLLHMHRWASELAANQGVRQDSLADCSLHCRLPKPE